RRPFRTSSRSLLDGDAAGRRQERRAAGRLDRQARDRRRSGRAHRTTAHGSEPGLRRCLSVRILVVDDDSRVSRTVGLGLRDAGYDVEHAADGDTALELATSRSWDLIVLDLMLPGRDGLDVLSGLRGRGVRIPILVLTGKARIE